MPISRISLGLFSLFIIGLFILVNALTLQWLLPGYTFYDIRRITQLSLFLIMGLMLISSKTIRQQSLDSFQQLPLTSRCLFLGFFILGLISAALAPLPKFAYLEWATFMMLLIMGISLAALRTLLIQSFDRIMLYTLITAIACYSLLVIGVLLMAATHPYIGLQSNKLFYVLAAPTFNNPRFLTQFMAWTLPLIVLPNLLYPSTSRMVRQLLYVIAAYWWCMAIVGQSRALGLACLLCAISLFIIFGKAARPYLLKQLWALIGGVILFFVLYQCLIHLPLRNIPLTDPDNRALIWSVALNLIKAHPMLGVGPMHFSYYAYAQEQLVAHPHNAILLIASQWGIPATLMLMTLVIWGLWRWCMFSRQEVKAQSRLTSAYLLIGITGSLIVAMVDSMFSGTLVMPVSQVMLALIGGWALGLYFYNRPKPVGSNWLAHYALIGLLVISVIMLILGVYPDIAKLPQDEFNFVASCDVATCVNSPYYWLQGWIQFY
ncbi:MAG: O-antigen ligase family protein [Gammaproteobacteria bacterium]|nr:O-antigen ligase family protein [Gammaproteobacteria bacterium]